MRRDGDEGDSNKVTVVRLGGDDARRQRGAEAGEKT